MCGRNMEDLKKPGRQIQNNLLFLWFTSMLVIAMMTWSCVEHCSRKKRNCSFERMLIYLFISLVLSPQNVLKASELFPNNCSFLEILLINDCWESFALNGELTKNWDSISCMKTILCFNNGLANLSCIHFFCGDLGKMPDGSKVKIILFFILLAKNTHHLLGKTQVGLCQNLPDVPAGVCLKSKNEAWGGRGHMCSLP